MDIYEVDLSEGRRLIEVFDKLRKKKKGVGECLQIIGKEY